MIDLLQCSLGMELGSTRIKAVLIDAAHTPLAQGDFTWENRLHRRDGETLADYLQTRVFAKASGETVTPSPADTDGFAAFLAQYKTALQAERTLTE